MPSSNLFPLMAASWLAAGMNVSARVSSSFTTPAVFLCPTEKDALPITVILVHEDNLEHEVSEDLQSILNLDGQSTPSIEVVLPQPTLSTRKLFNSFGLRRKELISVMSRSVSANADPDIDLSEFKINQLAPDQIETYVRLNQSEIQEPNLEREIQMVQKRMATTGTDLYLITRESTAIGNFAIQYWTNRLGEMDEVLQRLGFMDDKQVGGNDPGSFDLQSTAFVFDLLIHPQYRNQGIASHVLKQIESIVKEENTISRVGVFAVPSLIGFYSKLGFQSHSIIERWSSH